MACAIHGFTGQRPGRRAALGGATLLALCVVLTACGEQCWVIPTEVDLRTDAPFGRAPAELDFRAETSLGFQRCGPDPTRVVTHRWFLDDEPLESEDGAPLGAEVTVLFEEPGAYRLRVEVEDDLGGELPSVGTLNVLIF